MLISSVSINPLRFLVSEPDFARRIYLIAPLDIADALVSLLLEQGVIEISVVKRGDLAGEGKPLIEKLKWYIDLMREIEDTTSRFAQFISKRYEVIIKDKYEPASARLMLHEALRRLRDALIELESLSDSEAKLRRKATELKIIARLSQLLFEKYAGDSTLLDYLGEAVTVVSLYGDPKSIDEVSSKALATLAVAEVDEYKAASLIFPSKVLESMNLPPGIQKIEVLREAPRGSLEKVARWAFNQLEVAKREIEEIILIKQRIVDSNIRYYALLLAIQEAESSRLKTLRQALSTSRFVVISGLLPGSRCVDLEKALGDLPVYFFCEEEENPPAELRNMRLLKPFEILTRLVGAPTQTDWDPTPILSYAFITLFGLMIGDVGYGLLLVALSLIAPSIAPRLGVESGLVEKLKPLMMTCGISSTIAGFIYGSFFGDLPVRLFGLTLYGVFNPIKDMTDLMLFSILIGWMWLILSYTLGLLRALLKMKSLTTVLYSLSMIFLILSGPHVVLTMVFDKPLLPAIVGKLAYLVFMVGIGGLILTKMINLGVIGVILWVFDLSGLLTEVLSFIRISALAFGSALLANLSNEAAFSLFSAFPLLGVMVFVVGHSLGFTLGVIGALAHTLRLCYYEILTKFYSGGNRFLDYTLYSIPSRIVIEARVKY